MTNEEQIEALIEARQFSEYEHLNRNPLEPEKVPYITDNNVNRPMLPMYRDYHSLVSSSFQAIKDMYEENKRLREVLQNITDLSYQPYEYLNKTIVVHDAYNALNGGQKDEK